MRHPAVIALLSFWLAACGHAAMAGQPGAMGDLAAKAHGRTYTNPVLDSDFPDPCVVHAPDGYYAYATQGPNGGHFDNIACAHSTDMIHWSRLPDALPQKPAWAAGTQNFWAPHVMQLGGRWLMAFAAQADHPVGHDGPGMGIGLAEAPGPAGPFKPLGKPLLLENGFSGIDPFIAIDPEDQQPVMVWGSGFAPIRARKLTADGLAWAPKSQEVELLAPRQLPYEHLYEGAWIRQKNGYSYLFYSGDDCCVDVPEVGAPTYAVMVARSKSLMGPYERLQNPDGSAKRILAGNKRWLAPGHNALVTDAAGTDWLVYHAIDARQRFTPGTKDLRRPLLIDPLDYSGGWPHLAGDTPSTKAMPAPAL